MVPGPAVAGLAAAASRVVRMKDANRTGRSRREVWVDLMV
jgi:hypothetical protein